MLQTRVIKKPYVATPLLTKNWWFTTCIVVKEEQFLCQTRKNSKNKEEGSGSKKTGNPKNEQGMMKNIFNWIYGCSYVIKRKQTQKKQKERDKNSKDKRRQETRKKKKDWWEKKTL